MVLEPRDKESVEYPVESLSSHMHSPAERTKFRSNQSPWGNHCRSRTVFGPTRSSLVRRSKLSQGTSQLHLTLCRAPERANLTDDDMSPESGEAAIEFKSPDSPESM
jgi:hypothetical protein